MRCVAYMVAETDSAGAATSERIQSLFQWWQNVFSIPLSLRGLPLALARWPPLSQAGGLAIARRRFRL